jgi:hypothetical protein
VHDGKCSKKMQLQQVPEGQPGGSQCTMCKACSRVASRKNSYQAKSDAKSPSAGNSTGIVPPNNTSMQLRSSPTKKSTKETTEKSKIDAIVAPDRSTETTEKTRAVSKRKADEKANEGNKHCAFKHVSLSLISTCMFS